MPCIGDTDSRYNQDISYDLKEQENFWNPLEGLFLEEIVFYKSDGTPDTNNAVVPAPLGTYDFSNVKGFLVRRRDIIILCRELSFKFIPKCLTFVLECDS